MCGREAKYPAGIYCWWQTCNNMEPFSKEAVNKRVGIRRIKINIFHLAEEIVLAALVWLFY